MGERFEIGLERRWRILNWLLVASGVAAMAYRIVRPRYSAGLALWPLVWINAMNLIRYSLFRQYFEVRREGLLIHLGWRNSLIGWNELLLIETNGDFLRISSSRFSDARVRQPKDTARLFAEISKHCSHLSPNGFGLKVSMSPVAG